jgi:hypothetical protein
MARARNAAVFSLFRSISYATPSTRIAPSHPPGPIEIILEFDGHLLCHPSLLAALGYLRQDQLQWHGYRGTASHCCGCTRPAGSDQLSSASRRRALGVPIANENRLVLADALGTTIKSTSMAS